MNEMNNAVTNTSVDSISHDNRVTFGDNIGFRHAVAISKPHGVLDDVLEWCRREMADPDWRWQLISTSGRNQQGQYVFFFNNEQDYLVFVMRWR